MLLFINLRKPSETYSVVDEGKNRKVFLTVTVASRINMNESLID